MTNDPKKILVVDDEAQITRVLLRGLESAGYQVRVAADGRAGLETFRSWLPDLVITDLSMPGYTGLELCERIRQLSEVPVLVLSVKEDEPTKVKAFDLGADDYVAKPFGMAELTARVRALLRRTIMQPQADAAYEAGDFKIDPRQRLVEVNGKAVHLTPKEYDLIQYFLSNRGKVLTHRAILTTIWGSNSTEQPEYLRVFIANLRKKLEQNPRAPKYIKTEPWIGYRFDPE
ncbi:MAG TPA: response regulator transcription factor [Candidatus Angelobacter sp.]|jgi:two-component system KDP operon response regulator KdpE|nr:response regulator transcription factor [Candidatus Angelobacter sp.]